MDFIILWAVIYTTTRVALKIFGACPDITWFWILFPGLSPFIIALIGYGCYLTIKRIRTEVKR